MMRISRSANTTKANESWSVSGLILAFLCVCFMFVVALRTEKAVCQIDKEIVGRFYIAIKRLSLSSFLRMLTNLISVIPYLLALAIAKKQTELVLLFILYLAGGNKIVLLLKQYFKLPRPPFSTLTSYGFPSGHAFSAVLLGYICGQADTSLMRRILYGIVSILICLSRIGLGYHYVLDVVGGMMLCAMMILLARIILTMLRAGRIHPSWLFGLVIPAFIDFLHGGTHNGKNIPNLLVAFILIIVICRGDVKCSSDKPA